uniref:TonB-dependent receptor plug domain-containing protein n=1 Tax=Aliikangiella sp. G2MR2-5 TaxID=2788943 RepID=UPI0018AB78EE
MLFALRDKYSRAWSLQLAFVFFSLFLIIIKTAGRVKAVEQNIEIFSLPLDKLLSLKVTVASNIESDARKQPVSISSINKQQIKMSGARTLNELLTIFVPGYFLVEDQDDTIAGFRGLAPDNNSKVMLLLNGQNLNTEWFWGPPDAILNGLDLSFIERLEVIRGPGSVTLGQGALLGVINIVTSLDSAEHSSIIVSRGSEQLSKISLKFNYTNDKSDFGFYASKGQFTGNPMENRGWAEKRIDQGLSVFERYHYLHRSEYKNILGTFKFKSIQANLFHFEQLRDLYNFFRDRESVEQELKGLNLTYIKDFANDVNLMLSVGLIEDEYTLFSHGGNLPSPARLEYESNLSPFASVTNNLQGQANSIVQPNLIMGGTKENRENLKALIKYDLSKNSKLALGFEVDWFNSGNKNSHSGNFIVNEEIQLLGLQPDSSGSIIIEGSVNENNTWVKNSSYKIRSLFLENFWNASSHTDIFTAIRWDDHPNWGSHLSPRVALLYRFDEYHQLRISWQTGFRGAVGVQFSGGYVQDGFLAQENFPVVNAIADTLVDFNFDGDGTNDSRILRDPEPETIDSFEFAYSYLSPNVSFDNVIFFNTVENIIAAQAHAYDGLSYGDPIGSDSVGTWNGNWYYQNQEGKLRQWGIETEVKYKLEDWSLSASHSLVKIYDAAPGTIGFYTLENEKTSVYPENITRFQFEYRLDNQHGNFLFSLNDLYYWKFFSPNGNSVDGSHI